MLHEDSTKEPRSNSYLNYPTKVYITLNESRNKERHTIFPNSQGGKKTLAGVANYNVELGQWINWAIKEGIIDEKIANPCECEEVEIPAAAFQNCNHILSCVNTDLDISTPGSGNVNINFTNPSGTLESVSFNIGTLLQQTTIPLFTLISNVTKPVTVGKILTLNTDNSFNASFSGDILSLNVRRDPDASNTLEVRSDGLYVPSPGEYNEIVTSFETYTNTQDPTHTKYFFRYLSENGDYYHIGYDLQCDGSTLTLNRLWRKDATASGGGDTGLLETEIASCSIGGGTGAAFTAYEVANSGATLIHTSTANDITYNRTGSTGTISIPNGTDMRHFVLNETASNIAGATSFILEIEDLGSGVNDAGVESMKIPVLQFYSRDNLSNDPPTGTFPYNGTMDNPPTPVIQVVGYSNEKIIMRINNVDSYSEWSIIGNW